MASTFPDSLDALPTNHQDDVGEPILASIVNNLADAINKTQQALGVDLANAVLASAIDTDAALAADSDAKVASQKAVKAYVDANGGSRTVKITDDSTSPSVGEGAFQFTVWADLAGKSLSSVTLGLSTATATGTPTVQVRNVTQAADMLSTPVTVDAGELSSLTAAASAVVDAAHALFTLGDVIAIDVDDVGDGGGLGWEVRIAA